MLAYLLVGLCALAGTMVATPAVRVLATRAGFIDQPSDRKVHARPTPTVGGAALLLGMLVAAGAAWAFPGGDFRTVFTQSSELWGIGVGALLVFLLGVVDDVRGLPAPVKLAGQIFASGVVYLAGVRTQYILLPGGVISLSDDLSALVTVVWLVVMINAVNLVDGLDGLAAGICAIAASSFFAYSLVLAGSNALGPVRTAPLVAIIVVGVSLGFLRFNFYPASIFMGDSGAMLLGLVLGASTVSGAGKLGVSPGDSNVFLVYFPLLVPFAVLAIPLVDGVLAIIRRARSHRSIFLADKQHLHHRLMDLGHGHRQAVIVMYVWSALAAGAGLAFSFLDRGNVIFALPIAVGAIVLYTLFPLLTKVINERMTP